ncbi:MAG: hypothetical protein KKA81_16370 [Bacteroidetes bacterium]|nr:hypothetical protein [Bacteroidota bacterium]
MRPLHNVLAVSFLLSVLVLLVGSCSDNGPDNSITAQLVITPDLVFREVEYGVSPSAQWVIVSSSGSGAARYSARVASGDTWIGLYNQTNGIAPDSFIVNFQLGRLQAGTYLDTIIIESPDVANSPYMLPVRLVVFNLLQVIPPAFAFSMTSGGDEPAPEAMLLLGNSSTPIDLTLSHNSTWLDLEKTATSTPDTITLTATGTGLAAGTYFDTISIDAPTAYYPITVPCSLVVASWLKDTLDDRRDLRDVYFLNSSRGFAVGALNDATGGGLILRTDDGGMTWLTDDVPDIAVGNITFVDQDNGWAVGSHLLHRTRNGSAAEPTWTEQTITDTMNAVAFADTSLGWLVGKDGKILRTTNGGATWSSISPITSFSLFRLQFVGPDSGWAVGNNGVILFSADSGKSWVKQDWGGSNDLNGLFFTDNMNGWVVGALGIMLHTTDGGVTWNILPAYTSNDLEAVRFAPGGRGWAVGASGTILFTSDGSTWTSQPSGVATRLNSMFFLDDNVGWIVGVQGIVLRTTGGGL